MVTAPITAFCWHRPQRNNLEVQTQVVNQAPTTPIYPKRQLTGLISTRLHCTELKLCVKTPINHFPL